MDHGQNVPITLEEAKLSTVTDKKETNFQCNICLEQPNEPVVTLCGHLYCWACLYCWLKLKSTCPVCKSAINKSDIIPLYGRGCAEKQDPREHNMPPRPFGQKRQLRCDFLNQLWNVYQGVLTATTGLCLLFMQIFCEFISLVIHLPVISIFIYQQTLTNMQGNEDDQGETRNYFSYYASKLFLYIGIIFIAIIVFG